MHHEPYYGIPLVLARWTMAEGERLAAEARLARDDDALLEEWAVQPPGRHGRVLLAEIESYLEFFAIARAAA
jgi:hypothetical protein